MKCIVCDRCKQIIENPKRYRVILCSRPINPTLDGKSNCRSNDKQANDILWEKEVCLDCALEIENYTDVKADTPPIEDDKPGTTDPEEPDKDSENPEPIPGNGSETETTDSDEIGDGHE